MRIKLGTEEGTKTLSLIVAEIKRLEDRKINMILEVLMMEEHQLNELVRSERSEEYYQFFNDFSNNDIDPKGFSVAAKRFDQAFTTWLFSDLDEEEEILSC